MENSTTDGQIRRPERPATPEQYYYDSRVEKSIAQYTNVQGTLWSDIASTSAVYFALSPEQHPQTIPAPPTPIQPEFLSQAMGERRDRVEIHQSLWQKEDVIGYPARAIFVWDMEYYNRSDPDEVFRDPEQVFEKMEPVFRLFSDRLSRYGIAHIPVTSGRGYHFVTQVPRSSNVMEQLIEIGGTIEPTVVAKQAATYEKRDRPVSPNAELAHKGVVRLQQYMINAVINEARRRVSPDLNIEISDKGEVGIAFDNTAATRTVDTSTAGVAGSLYAVKSSSSGEDFLVRVPRGDSLEATLEARKDYAKAAELLGNRDCTIPDGSDGTSTLIEAYKNSELYTLHRTMDADFGDQPSQFDKTYRRYGLIAQQTGESGKKISDLIHHANDQLLQPDNLDYFIFEVFKAWGGRRDDLSPAPHVAALLRAIYEDPNLHWGARWISGHDAFRHARGWTELILGQMFEE